MSYPAFDDFPKERRLSPVTFKLYMHLQRDELDVVEPRQQLIVSEVPIAHRAVRLRRLERMAIKAEERKNYTGRTTHWEAGDAHRVACETLKLKDYWMRDARHTWAVRWARSGGSPQQGALQLGHKDATLFLKVYGVYYPTSTEREQWEQAAAKQDAAAMKTTPRTTKTRRSA
jgi:integrase